MTQTKNTGKGTSYASFSTSQGAGEHFITVTTDLDAGFPQSLAQLEERYTKTLAACGLSTDTQVFTRVCLGDVANQAPLFRQSPLYAHLIHSALSVVGQSCLNGGTASLFSYHVTGDAKPYPRHCFTNRTPGANSLVLTMQNYQLLWNAGFGNVAAFDSYRQTQEIFGSLGDIIHDQHMNLLSHTIRSWVYVRDIDNHYKGMVNARREFFAGHDLTEKTRYLASTGIEGRAEQVNSLVTVDALSVGGLQEGQIERMDALENMSRTIDYGVTFERGLRVRFGDRSHLYISGTASIDREGRVVHPGDAAGQTRRTIENIVALLATQGGKLDDLAYLLVYVRDNHDYLIVRDILSSAVSADLPVLYFYAAVCRPAWLVEMEGVAVMGDASGFSDFR